MNWFYQRFLTLYTYLKHPKVKGNYRWLFLRLKYEAKFHQIKYLFQDRIVKKPYKVVSFQGEFQQELINALPFAYWHYCNGTLLRTISSLHTKSLYYFSPDHIEQFDQRDPSKNFEIEIPNAPHTLFLNKNKWSPVPLKQKYKNEIFIFDKPILVIANRFNTEWHSKTPISFIDIDTLIKLIELLSGQYQIIYNRPSAKNIIGDNSAILEFDDFDAIKKSFNDVILLEDLFIKHKQTVSDFNHLQLMVYSNCEHFISVHGGTATLASYFGGVNFVLSVQGHEHYLEEFTSVFPELSSAKVIHCRSNQELLSQIKEYNL